jgi:hypothetical protein
MFGKFPHDHSTHIRLKQGYSKSTSCSEIALCLIEKNPSFGDPQQMIF